MLKTKLFLIGFFMIGHVTIVHAQKASEGKAVVSHGFEHSDSVRFGLLRPFDVAQWNGSTGVALVNAQIDTMGCSAEEDFDLSIPLTYSTLYGHRKVLCAPGTLTGAFGPDLRAFGQTVRQRMYLPWIKFPYSFNWRWRYNDLLIDSIHARLHNNTYDSNDVSPYAEYPANPGFVTGTFKTRRYNYTIDSTVYYGNEGRVVLGYSDERDAKVMLTVPLGFPFPSVPGHFDTAKAFSVNLEFAVDTAKIDMTDDPNPSDTNDAPLVRLQVLFKDSGQSVLPFVPFKTASDTTQPGWFRCLDTVITRAVYRSLPDDWRADDSTFSASSGYRAHSWRFKQLHAIIKLSRRMDSIRRANADSVSANIPSNSYDYNAWGSPSDPLGNPMFGLVHEDSLVYAEHIFGSDTSLEKAKGYLLELRVLSTYRATVRIRDLTWQDTMADRYLNRRRFGDSTHSVEQNGTYGGNDKLMDSTLKSWSNELGGNVPREIMYNDNGLPPTGFPGIGYEDYLGSKYNIFVHMRPQDWGDFSLMFRRSRMSLDGQQPSIIESQAGSLSPLYFPRDYVYYGHKIDTTTPWGQSVFDTLMGQLIVRSCDTGTDTLHAYKLWTAQNANQLRSLYRSIRLMSRVAQYHPWSKRFGVEYSIRSFSYVSNGAYDSNFTRGGILYDSIIYRGHYDVTLHQWDVPSGYGYSSFPPYTPEMITSETFGSFANGATAISAAESFGNSFNDHGTHNIGAFSPAPHTNSLILAPAYTHGYNIGHYYTCRTWNNILNGNDSSDMDGPIPNYYLGMSNTYRAHVRSVARMNAIWNTGPHPVKSLRWLDAYSLSNIINPTSRYAEEDPGVTLTDTLAVIKMDSISFASAFLKVDSTRPVNSLLRNSGKYIDLPTLDPDTARFVEVGMFEDSISTSQKNYAALVVNDRLYPSFRDTADLNYYNNGLDSISKVHSTLGDIDVRKVYLKLDLSKTDPAFQGNTYYVVRDLWHPDSTWLLNKDSTFAVYIKPGDAKFLYFEKGIAVNVASRTGTDTGKSSQAEFGFNNGRRVAEIMHGTHDVITYTRNNHLYVSYPALGRTFSGPDQSSGDNIITGYEVALDTTHTCARPSISVGPNDTSVALTYWYLDGSGTGHIGAAYRKDTGSAWVMLTPGHAIAYPDTTGDHSFVTPVITPISDTTWLIVAHCPSLNWLVGSFLITKRGVTPAVDSNVAMLIPDKIRHDGSVAFALFPTVGWRPHAPNHGFLQWTTHLAWQIDTTAHVHQIYFTRIANLQPPTPSTWVLDSIVDVSSALGACDNVHPSLALNGTVEPAVWLIGISKTIGSARFYHDNLAWESEFHVGGYSPIVRNRHEADSSSYHSGFWGAFNVFSNGTGYRYPQISADFRTWDSHSPRDSTHDWIRMVYSPGNLLYAESWAPNWMRTPINELGYNPTDPQTTNDPGSSSWSDSGIVPRSISWTASGTGLQPVRITNGYMPRIGHSVFPHILLIASAKFCDTLWEGVSLFPPVLKPPIIVPTTVNWAQISPSFAGPDEAWTNPEGIPNVEHTNAFAFQACDSILVPRLCDTNNVREIQDSLKSSSDYVQFRLLLCRTADSTILGTIDSMRITRTAIRWAGMTAGIDPDTARYKVSCSASPDSAFVMAEVLRGDTTNSIHRYYVQSLDTTGAPPPPAPKRAAHPFSITDSTGILVTVHPNPARTFVEICVEDLPQGVPASAIVVNQAGETVATLYNATPEGELGLCMRLDCSNLPSGTYYAYIQNAIMGTVVKFQVIK